MIATHFFDKSSTLVRLNTYLKMYLLNFEPKKLDTSDYQILKMTHPSSKLEYTTRAPSIGEREKKFASQIKQLLWHTVESELQPVHRAVHLHSRLCKCHKICAMQFKEIKCWIQNE